MSSTLRWGFGGAVLAAALVVVAGCSGSTSGGSASSTGSTGPLEAKLRPVVTSAMTQMRVPGAVVYVGIPGQEPWQAALGVSDTSSNTPMNIADHMRIGSLTKTFTATVLLQLAQEGKVDLDKPAAKYLPGAPTNGASVRQLLAMTSGVYNYSVAPGFLDTINTDPTHVWTSEELLDFARQNTPYFKPGKGYHYTNTNYVMLGMIAEKVGGKPVGDLISERIIAPLSLRGCSYPSDPAIPDPHSQGYQFGPFTPPGVTPAPVPSDKAPDLMTAISPTMAGASGAMVCTLDDMRIWSQALASGQLLSPEMQQQRVTGGPTEPGSAATYGLGIQMIGNLRGHGGLILGFTSSEYSSPKDGVTVVVLTNLAKAPDGKLPAETIALQIITALASADSTPSGGSTATP